MLNRSKLINIGIGVGIVSALCLIIAMVGPAIKFFFRGLLAMMNHPIEALCFITLLMVFGRLAGKVTEG